MARPRQNKFETKSPCKRCDSTVPYERGVHVSATHQLITIRERIYECAKDEPLYINVDVEYWADRNGSPECSLTKADFAFVLALTAPKSYRVDSLETICQFRADSRVIERIRFKREDVIK